MAEAQTLLSGEKTLTETNKAERLTSVSQIITGMVVRANKLNTANVYIGPSTVSTTSYYLEPAESLQFDVIDPARVYVYGKANDTLSFFGLIP